MSPIECLSNYYRVSEGFDVTVNTSSGSLIEGCVEWADIGIFPVEVYGGNSSGKNLNISNTTTLVAGIFIEVQFDNDLQVSRVVSNVDCVSLKEVIFSAGSANILFGAGVAFLQGLLKFSININLEVVSRVPGIKHIVVESDCNLVMRFKILVAGHYGFGTILHVRERLETTEDSETSAN